MSVLFATILPLGNGWVESSRANQWSSASGGRSSTARSAPAYYGWLASLRTESLLKQFSRRRKALARYSREVMPEARLSCPIAMIGIVFTRRVHCMVGKHISLGAPKQCDVVDVTALLLLLCVWYMVSKVALVLSL